MFYRARSNNKFEQMRLYFSRACKKSNSPDFNVDMNEWSKFAGATLMYVKDTYLFKIDD
jgi:hypothetical protein